MDGNLQIAIRLSTAVLAIAVLPSCKDPLPINSSRMQDAGQAAARTPPNEDCPADPTWLPADGGLPPPVRMFEPLPHPDTECPFYRGAYQNFLIATQPLANGDPILVNYATLDDAFQSAYNTNHQRNTGDPSADPKRNPGGAAAAALVRSNPMVPTGKAWLGAIKQAGQRNILIDQDFHSLYYGLHMNQAFVDFIVANKLQTVDGILKVDPNLAFPAGLVEFKTAWKDIDPLDFPNGQVPPPTSFASDPGDYSNYITTKAWIPWLHQDPTTGAIIEDPDHPVERRVALVAIHCVYTLPGHPEFVWGSIQHVNINEVDPAPVTFAGVSIMGAPDTAPDTTGPTGQPALPDPMDPQNFNVTRAPSMDSYLLFKGGTAEGAGNKALVNSDIKGRFDEATQSFPGLQTSVYRMFPGSKSTTLQPDSAVFSLNSNINVLFQAAINAKAIDPQIDKRQHYRLVAATWLDKPALFGLGDGKGMSLQNDDTSPLVVAAKKNDPLPSVTQGTFCGTPRDSSNTSGNDPAATGLNNTVPGCVTRADLLMAGPDGGGDPSADFAANAAGTDSPFSLLGGEDRLSSTAMETFTQNNTFHNCFACHNTQPINTNGTAFDPTCTGPACPAPLIPHAAKINVSHLFSEFVLREQEAAARAAGH
jgi:hypothetical protein